MEGEARGSDPDEDRSEGSRHHEDEKEGMM